MDVSVIVPLYKGNKYIFPILKMVSDNIKYIHNCDKAIQLELIFVNDYPEEPIIFDISTCEDFFVKIIENSVNCGIHQTRVNGLKNAKGKYVLFLDQDDKIEDNCIISQLESIGKGDLVVGNGYRMFGNQKRVIYKDKKKQKLVLNVQAYLKAANQIVSPGHCLIKKDSIPNEWKDIIITQNGGDDMFLWLLFFSYSREIRLNYNRIYTHVDTGNNVSRDMDVMLKSAKVVIESSKKSGVVPYKFCELYNRRVDFLRSYYLKHRGIIKLIDLVKYLDIVVWKLYARLV